MADFDIRRMLDRYVYDYFIKRNLPVPAEIFKNEANLEFDPEVPPAIDVPEGFLLEWWTMSYEFDCFREWLNQHVGTLGKSPSTHLDFKQVKLSLEATQEHNASCSGQFLMHSEKNKQLLIDSASAMSTGSKSTALHGRGQAPLVFSPSSYQEGPLTTTLAKCTPINYANTIGQKPEPLIYTTPKTANTGLIEESDPWIESLVSSFWVFEDQKELHNKLALGEKIAGSTSQVSLGDDNASETSDCTSKIPRLSTASDASTVHQLDSNKEK